MKNRAIIEIDNCTICPDSECIKGSYRCWKTENPLRADFTIPDDCPRIKKLDESYVKGCVETAKAEFLANTRRG